MGPARRTLRKCKILRGPDVKEKRPPPDFDHIFAPHPARPSVDVGDMSGSLWGETIDYVLSAMAQDGGDTIVPGRLPLLFLVSSFGRGKPLIFCEAAWHLYADANEGAIRTNRPAKGRGVVSLGVIFNGHFRSGGDGAGQAHGGGKLQLLHASTRAPTRQRVSGPDDGNGWGV